MINYRAVGNRCAISLAEYSLIISTDEALTVLENLGFRVVEVDMVALARQLISISKYRRGVSFKEAPGIIDCSSMMKWLFAQRGIWVPRYADHQFKYSSPVYIEDVTKCELVFRSGSYNFDPEGDGTENIGHVGLASGDGTVIHATNKVGVEEVPIEKFTSGDDLRIAGRYINSPDVITLEIPPDYDIEFDREIIRLILISMSRQIAKS